MIPQNLLLAFLSLQWQDQGRSAPPQSSQLDLNVFDSVSSTPANHQVKGLPEVEPVRVEEPDQQSLVSIEERKIHWFPVSILLPLFYEKFLFFMVFFLEVAYPNFPSLPSLKGLL